MNANIEDFKKIDIRVGKILEVEDCPQARKPVYKLTVDFGPELGIKKSLAGITHYKKEELLGRQVLGVINFPPRQIGPYLSEFLTLGASDEDGKCILIKPDRDTPIGSRIY